MHTHTKLLIKKYIRQKTLSHLNKQRNKDSRSSSSSNKAILCSKATCFCLTLFRDSNFCRSIMLQRLLYKTQFLSKSFFYNSRLVYFVIIFFSSSVRRHKRLNNEHLELPSLSFCNRCLIYFSSRFAATTVFVLIDRLIHSLHV